MTDYPPDRDDASLKLRHHQDRRIGDIPWGDTSRILAIMYTLGFMVFVCSVTWFQIPEANEKIVAQILAIISMIQSGIVGYFFGSSKSAEVSLKAGVVARQKADSTIQDIAKAPPTNGIEAPKDKIVVPEQVLKITKPKKKK